MTTPTPEPVTPPGGRRRGHRWPPLLVFLLVVAGLLLGLRLVHLAVPLLYPAVLSGPFSLETVAEAEPLVGFAPRLPFYRPEVLGTAPVHVTARRRPQPQVTVFWQGDRFLYLAERRGGPRPFVRPEARPLPGHPESSQWREGRTWRVVLEQDGLWIELRTDLPEEDLHRLVETLRPYRELR